MKKTNISILFVVGSILFLNLHSGAQEKLLRGQVTTFDSIAVTNASIKVKSTGQVVLSDTLGFFEVICNRTDKLLVSAGGFYQERVKISENIKLALINLKLRPGEENREIAVGYGYVRDRDKLYAVSSLEIDKLNAAQYTDIYQMLQGRIPGLQIINGEIIIRGQSSINSSSAALLVVDGNVVSPSVFGSIVPSDVGSIDVLKDGSAAIYGSRGANGVVIVQTKRGKAPSER